MKNLCTDVILGIDFQEKHSSISIVYHGNRPTLIVSNSKQSSNVCSLAKANVSEVSLFSSIDPKVRPYATKSRKFNEENSKFIEAEIQKLLQEGIIEESKSPWRAQIVIVKDDLNRHKKRMCIDYSATVNIHTQLDAYPLPNIESMINKLAEYEYFSTFDLKSAYHQIGIKDSDKPFTAFEANNKLYQFTRIPFGVTNGVASFQRAVDKIIEEEQLKDVYPYVDNITIAGRTKQELESNVSKFQDMIKKRKLTLNESKSIYSSKCIKILGYEIEKNLIKPDPDRLQPLQDFPLPKSKKALQRVLGMFAYYAKWIPKFSEIASPLYKSTQFPLETEAHDAFTNLKLLLGKVLVK